VFVEDHELGDKAALLTLSGLRDVFLRPGFDATMYCNGCCPRISKRTSTKTNKLTLVAQYLKINHSSGCSITTRESREMTR
jgi:hypothetical protein